MYGWYRIFKDLQELKELCVQREKYVDELEEENRKLKSENEYLHKLLPEADGYVIEKQMEKRLWNDGEEDVYEDWGE